MIGCNISYLSTLYRKASELHEARGGMTAALEATLRL